MNADGAGTDEDVTVTVTVKRSELDAVAETLGTATDTDTVLASLESVGAFDRFVIVDLRDSDLRMIKDAFVRTVQGTGPVPPGSRAAITGPLRAAPSTPERRQAVSRDEYAALFAGQAPMDPDRFRRLCHRWPRGSETAP